MRVQGQRGGHLLGDAGGGHHDDVEQGSDRFVMSVILAPMIVDDVFINVAADDDNVYKEYVINSPCVSDEDCGFASFQLPRDF